MSEARPAGRRDYGGAVVGGVAGGLLGNQVGRGHGREAATAVGAVVGAIAGDNIANRGRCGTAVRTGAREVTSVPHRQRRAERVDRLPRRPTSTAASASRPDAGPPGRTLPVRVSVDPVGAEYRRALDRSPCSGPCSLRAADRARRCRPGPTSAATRPRPWRSASPAAACWRWSGPRSTGKPVWRVKVLTAQGEVRVIIVDAAQRPRRRLTGAGRRACACC